MIDTYLLRFFEVSNCCLGLSIVKVECVIIVEITLKKNRTKFLFCFFTIYVTKVMLWLFKTTGKLL